MTTECKFEVIAIGDLEEHRCTGVVLMIVGKPEDVRHIAPLFREEVHVCEAAAYASLISRVEMMEEALAPFAAVAEHDIGEDETDADRFRPMSSMHNRAPLLTVGDLRRAFAALQTRETE